MEYAEISVSFTYILARVPNFLGTSHLMFYICTLVWQFRNIFYILLTHSPTSHLQHLMKTFWTPLALYRRNLSCISDRLGQSLLLQTSSLLTCASTLGGLPNGLGIICSVPACTNIFLMVANRKSLCEIFLPPHEEQRKLTIEDGQV
jgi:hypothetical protein